MGRVQRAKRVQKAKRDQKAKRAPKKRVVDLLNSWEMSTVMMTITMLHVILMVGIVVVEQKISAKYVNVWKTMITMTTMTMMLILTMMIGGMKELLPNLSNQRVKVKRVLK